MKKNFMTISTTLWALLLISCSSPEQYKNAVSSEEHVLEFDTLAIKLNNQAIELSTQSPSSDSALALAKRLLIRSIGLDDDYYLAYVSLASILIKEDKRDSALYVLDRIIEKKKNYAEGISMQGYIYDRMGMLDSAKIKYIKAIAAYDNILKKNERNVNARVNKAFLVMLVYGEKAGYDEINLVLKEYPNNSSALMMKNDFFPTFDKEDFLESY
jgi:tetratricopeptide (TPR) repeat protein